MLPIINEKPSQLQRGDRVRVLATGRFTKIKEVSLVHNNPRYSVYRLAGQPGYIPGLILQAR